VLVALPRLELELSIIEAPDVYGDVGRVAVMTTATGGHPSIAERIWVQAAYGLHVMDLLQLMPPSSASPHAIALSGERCLPRLARGE
jgi:hypothetical protein